MSQKSLIPKFPRTAWVLLGGDAISAIGGGLVLPFLIVYLHKVRDFDLRVATLVLSMLALVGLIGAPVGGAFIDRFGARRSLMLGLVVTSIGTAGIAFVHHPWQAFLTAAIEGFGVAMLWPGIQSMLAQAVGEHQRSSIFAVHFAILNGGFAIGGLIGGILADASRPRSFEVLYLVDALTFLVYVAVLTRVKGVGDPAPRTEEDVPVGYRQVFKDPIFVRVWLLMVLVVMIGYAQIESAYPAFATGEGGISTHVLGFAFAANMVTIAAIQLVVLRKLEGHRRTRAVALLFTLWGASWLLTMLSGALDDAFAAVGFVLVMVVFAAGETLMSPTLPALVNDIAPERLRGRYNAAYSLSWSVGHIVGPAAAGVFLAAGLAYPYFLGLTIACALAALYALRLERVIPSKANVIREDEEPTLLEPALQAGGVGGGASGGGTASSA